MMETFATWTVTEKNRTGSSLMDTINESSWLKSSFCITKPKFIIAMTKKRYYTNLNNLNICLTFIHGLLYDLEFSRFVLKHEIFESSLDFFTQTSELREAFFAYALIKAYSGQVQFDMAKGFPLFKSLIDKFIDILGLLPMNDEAIFDMFNQLIRDNFEQHSRMGVEDVLKHHVNQLVNPAILNSIYMNYIFKILDFSVDLDGRWNYPALEYLKTRKDVDIVFFSHMQHLTRHPVKGTVVTLDMVEDYKKQNKQKTIIINEFFEKIDRKCECEFTDETHSKLFLIPHQMGKLQYLMLTHGNLVMKYDKIQILDDQPGALFKWLDLPKRFNYSNMISKMFQILIPKLEILISPTEYGLVFLAAQHGSIEDVDEDVRNFMKKILNSIIYREDLYDESCLEDLPLKWGYKKSLSIYFTD